MRKGFMAALIVLAALATASPAWAGFGLSEEHGFEVAFTNQDGSTDTQAGSHPFAYTTTLTLNGSPFSEGGNVRDIEVELFPGLVGDPGSVPTCSISEFDKQELAFGDSHPCSNDTQIGVVELDLNGGRYDEPIYNLTPRKGTPAEFGFIAFVSPVVLVPSVRTGSDYGVTVKFSSIPNSYSMIQGRLTLWGVPAAPGHDAERGACLKATAAAPSKGKCPASVAPKPFLSMPTSCTGPVKMKARVDSWEAPGVWSEREYTTPGMTGCEKLGFAPNLVVSPEPAQASSPSGLSVEIQVPQTYDSASGLATANLKDTTVALPAGVALNPAAADGLEACSEAQIALHSTSPIGCPDGSKVGSVEITTPLLSEPLRGGVYLAQQGNLAGNGSNPFGSLLAIYIGVEDPQSGVTIKLAGEVKPDPATGQLVTTFLGNPQLPFDSLKLSFFGGPRAALVNPSRCGSYTASAQMSPWSGGSSASPSSTFQITSGPAGSACLLSEPFSPSVVAGTTSNQAGAYTPFTFTLDRGDGEQNPSRIQVVTPPGLLGVLAHVTLCGEPAAQQGACSQDSLVGHVTVAVGAGSNPFYVTGKVYLTGGYNGAPYGLSFVVPAVAGPLNLGVVVVRAAVNVDPHTAVLTVTSEPLPQILQGVPLHIRAVNVVFDRPEFVFNPTSCEPLAIHTTLSSGEGATSTATTHFQVTNCAALSFKPQFKAYTSGKTSRSKGASLQVKLSFPKEKIGSNASVAQVKVDLPKRLPARLTTLQKACVAATFDANPAACPAASRVGFAEATTPVMPVPLRGPVYFVSHGGAAFPDLIIVLEGYGVRVDLVGNTYINKHNVTSSTFRTIPDVPVDTFQLYLPEGANSALAANGNLCKVGKLMMPTAFTAQDGTSIHTSTPIGVSGCKAKSAKSARTARARRGGRGGRVAQAHRAAIKRGTNR